MTDTLPALTDKSARPGLDPQRRAWGIMLLAFGAFCFLCVVTGIGVSYFVFQSTVPLDVTLRVGRGTVSVSSQSVYADRPLVNNDELTTDRQSQGVIFFQSADQLLAIVTVRGGTSALIRRTVQPRFDWSSGVYGIDLLISQGEMEVFMPQADGRDVRLNITTTQGDRIDLSSGGQYFISASAAQLRVVNRVGNASLVPANLNIGRSIPANNQGIINYLTDATAIVTSDAFINLLANGTFQSPVDDADGGSTPAPTNAWACSNRQDSPPSGDFHLEMKDGRWTMRVVRDNGAISNGETRCLSYFGQNGVDVSSYNYLEMRVAFSIHFQSLEVCGFQGSECPLMLRMDYIDKNGDQRIWYHGFYYRNNPQVNYPLQCNSCSQEHEIVNENSWYTYDSGNMFNLFSPAEQPARIINVQFYASGHEYDVYIGEAALLAGSSAANP